VSHYPSLADYNADIIRAREAYAADMRVQAGHCENECGRKRDTRSRKCWGCRHA